jgi:hypothetical protein
MNAFVAAVRLPAKNRAKDLVEIGALQLVGDQDQANNHRTDLT